MISALITVLVVLVLAGLVYWVIHRLAATFGIPSQIVVVADVVLVVLVVVWLLQALGLIGRALVIP